MSKITSRERSLAVALSIFFLLVGLVIVSLPARADEIEVPVIVDAAERNYVGETEYLRDGTQVFPGSGEEIVYYLITGNPLRDSSGKLVASIVEIRANLQEVPPQRRPLLRLIWDEDHDGYADYYAESIPGVGDFRVIAIPKNEKVYMGTIDWFPPRSNASERGA